MAAFDWRKYLGVAQALQSAGNEESNRSAISRAYYAAYGTAELRRKADKLPRFAGRGSAHQALWNAYKSAPDSKRRQIGVDGHRLKLRRVKADYRESEQIKAQDARRAVSDAERLVEAIDGL